MVLWVSWWPQVLALCPCPPWSLQSCQIVPHVGSGNTVSSFLNQRMGSYFSCFTNTQYSVHKNLFYRHVKISYLKHLVSIFYLTWYLKQDLCLFFAREETTQSLDCSSAFVCRVRWRPTFKLRCDYYSKSGKRHLTALSSIFSDPHLF